MINSCQCIKQPIDHDLLYFCSSYSTRLVFREKSRKNTARPRRYLKNMVCVVVAPWQPTPIFFSFPKNDSSDQFSNIDGLSCVDKMSSATWKR